MFQGRVTEAAWMAHSDDFRKRVVEAVFRSGMSRNASAERFEVSIASAVRWAHRFSSTGAMSPAPTADLRSDRIEANSDYLLGLIRRQSDVSHH
jgi:transposase